MNIPKPHKCPVPCTHAYETLAREGAKDFPIDSISSDLAFEG